ncbi:MAG: SH3 domain-containing protein [Marinilabiliaceae bacterium]
MATITSATALKSIAAAGKKVVATQSDPLNLRQSPSTSGALLLRIPRGATVDTLNCSTAAGWTAVRYNGKEGFVASQYLAAQSPATVVDNTQIQPDSSVNTSVNTLNQSTYNQSSMGEKIKKYGKYVLIAAGVGLAVYAGYKLMKKDADGGGSKKKSGKTLGGVSLRVLKLKK